jgi:hypothetical protein
MMAMGSGTDVRLAESGGCAFHEAFLALGAHCSAGIFCEGSAQERLGEPLYALLPPCGSDVPAFRKPRSSMRL